MKIFFDTNVYVAESLDGRAATAIVEATERAAWRIFCSDHVLGELRRVLVDELGFPPRLAGTSRDQVLRRAQPVIPPPSRHRVPQDAMDSPVLNAAIAANVDYLVTNDRHLLLLDPYEGIRIVSMADYHDVLVNEGLLP